MPARPLRAAALLGLLLGPLATGAEAAGDVAQNEAITLADDPFQITDPRPTPPGEVSVTAVGAYERAPRGRVRDTYGAETALSFGVAPNLDLRFGQTGAYGNLETRRRLGTLGASAGGEEGEAALGGTTRIGALYQLNRESGQLPNIGVVGRLRALYGPGNPAYEAEAVALFGKTLIPGELPLGVSLNLGLVTRLDPTTQEERPTRYLVNASIGQAITRDTALVLTYAREQQERGEADFSLIQAGIRHRLRDEGAIVGLAVGFGLNQSSPQLQVAFGVQWELGGAGAGR